MPKVLLQLAFVVELIVCLAAPVALLLVSIVMLPILAIALPTDMVGSPNPREPLLLVVQLAIGAAGGGLGLLAIFELARHVLTGRPVRTGRRALTGMLLAFGVALAIAYVVTGGPSSTRAGLLFLALPGAFIAHLVHRTRSAWAESGPKRSGGVIV